MTSPQPLFILCPGRSFSSVVCGMLGVHPELYGLPELNLFCADTLGELFRFTRTQGQRTMCHGILRVIAQLHGGEQTEKTVDDAKGWLTARIDWSTRDVFAYVADAVAPRRCVDKSPPYSRATNLKRLFEAYPDAQFLHLGRHPRPAGNSTFKAYQKTIEQVESMNRTALLGKIEQRWCEAHATILRFTAQLPDGQAMYLQGELLLNDPEYYLPQIAEWLGVSKAPAAIEAMKHPEMLPYASPGPVNARAGFNRGFLTAPRLRADKIAEASLEGPLEWMPEGRGFDAKSIVLAQQLGYR